MIIRPKWTLVALVAVTSSSLTSLVGPEACCPVTPRVQVGAGKTGLPSSGARALSFQLGGVAVSPSAPVAPTPAVAIPKAPVPFPVALKATRSVKTPAAPQQVQRARSPFQTSPSVSGEDDDELLAPDDEDPGEEGLAQAPFFAEPANPPAPAARPESETDEIARLTARLQRNPDDVVALNNLAVLYASKPQMTPFAESLFGILQGLNPSDPVVAANLKVHRARLDGVCREVRFASKGQLRTMSSVSADAGIFGR